MYYYIVCCIIASILVNKDVYNNSTKNSDDFRPNSVLLLHNIAVIDIQTTSFS